MGSTPPKMAVGMKWKRTYTASCRSKINKVGAILHVAAVRAEPIIDGLVGFLGDPDNREAATTIKDAYLSAYTADDVEIVTTALKARFVERYE